MKHYLAVPKVIKHSKTYGFSTIELKVYMIKSNRLTYQGSVRYNSNSTKWEEWEAMDVLLHNCLITKKQWSYSEWPRSGPWYYSPEYIDYKNWFYEYMQTSWLKDKSKWFTIKVLQ